MYFNFLILKKDHLSNVTFIWLELHSKKKKRMPNEIDTY